MADAPTSDDPTIDGTTSDGTTGDGGAAALHPRTREAAAKAEDLIFDTINPDLPKQIRDQLHRQVVGLILEGWDPNTEFELIDDALHQALLVWDERPGFSPKMLPHFYADAIKKWFRASDES
jgi:hypothetical protein